MDKKTRLIALGALGIVLVGVLAYVWFGGSGSQVDTTIVDTAAQASQDPALQGPVDDSPPQKKVRPNGMSPN